MIGYGASNSILYWVQTEAFVYSVEHAQKWFSTMGNMSSRVKYMIYRSTKTKYAKAISEVGCSFDIIVADRVWRNKCLKKCTSFLEEGGILILDNSDWYEDTDKFLRGQGFFRITLLGIGQINDYCWTTSILNRFKTTISGKMLHTLPVAGIEASREATW